jgi:protein SCO1/2
MKASCETSRLHRSRSERLARAGTRTLLAVVAVVLAVGAADAQDLRAGVFKPARAAPEFALNGSDGATVTIKRFHGKVIALGFGYTSCADVCPTTLAFLVEARKELGTAAKDFQVLYVTVDPERDNVPRLRKYMDAFDTSFIGATGTPADLDDVRKAYGITMTKQVSKVDPNAYQIHHSAFVYLIDRDGSLRAIIPFGATATDMAHDVKVLLAEHP